MACFLLSIPTAEKTLHFPSAQNTKTRCHSSEAYALRSSRQRKGSFTLHTSVPWAARIRDFYGRVLLRNTRFPPPFEGEHSIPVCFLRINNEIPKSSSSFFMLRLSAGWERYRISVASESVLYSVKAVNCWSSYTSIIFSFFQYYLKL